MMEAKQTIFERMGGTYTLGEDGIYYPDLVINGAGMAVVLEQNVGYKVVIIIVADIDVLENCQDYLLHVRYDL